MEVKNRIDDPINENKCAGENVPKAKTKKEPIPEQIPEEKNVHIDNIKKRRSSLRRSITGGFSSTLRVSCASIDAELPPNEKKRRIAEICLNQTLQELKMSCSENEYDSVMDFDRKIRSNYEDILRKIESTNEGTAHKQESETRKNINQIKEERAQWNEEFAKRKQAYQDARTKLKDVLKGKLQIETAHLKSEDTKFLKNLPDFVSFNKKIINYRNRHYLGLVNLEKSACRVHHTVLTAEKKLNKVQSLMAPPFAWI